MQRLRRHLRKVLAAAAITVILLAACGVDARAQGSRKDDIVFNAQGRPMAGATVRVCTAAATGQPCSPLALIYSDPGLTQALANPIATDGLGNYSFYASPGRYEIEISGPSILTKQLPNVILPSDPTAPTFTTVTTTSGISAFSLSLAGNLTVSGSAAVTGSFTVGGAPVASTGADNQWTSPQRFKGPDPWRDITAYMPAGGCDNTGASLTGEVGTINAGSTALGITFDNGFKNGCGIFVYGAGAASTLSTPAQGTAPNPNVIGAAGTTTVHYKVAAIDAKYGTSAASSPITIATAPTTRTPLNYVGVYWQGVAGAIGYLVYSDAGGSYAPLGYSFDCFGFAAGNTCGIIDKGTETHTWTDTVHSFWPLTPPASVTNQALITTIVSGAGTLSLTLAAAATNSVSGSFTFPDNSPFLGAAITAAANDGAQFDRSTVLIPQGMWFTSTIPFSSGSINGDDGVKIVLSGQLEIFGLPIEGNLAGAGTTGHVSISGTGGVYQPEDWIISCNTISGYPSLGALFVVESGGLELSHICVAAQQANIIADTGGDITTQDVVFTNTGSGPMLQVDNNAFFSLFDRTNWNANNSNDNVPAIWFLGLTNAAHTSVFDFRDNSFIAHTIRVDQAVPGGGGPTGNFVFDGTTDIEDGYDPGFIVTATCTPPQGITLDNILTGDLLGGPQDLFYFASSCGSIGGNPEVNIHGQTAGFAALVGSSVNPGMATNCRAWTYESPNSGGSGAQSIGNWGSIFGTYSGCDLGITQTGYDVQTTEVLTSGGNDPVLGPAGEQIIGHVFRRPQTTVSGTGSGSLGAATYYIVATAVDVAGRESAPSPEISQAVGASSSISLSATSGIYFPAGCNFYFGTSPGTEGNYFASTSVTNGTCTYTLTSTSGETAKAPVPVGNAMRSWLTEENNASSCLFCGSGGGLGTGFLGFNLTTLQYSVPPAGVQFPFNGGVHSYKFYSASETSAPTGASGVDQLYADSTAHRWKKIENNGAAQTVASADSAACAYQGPASPVTGTGAAATYFTCTIPAGVMGAGQGIIITALAKHTTGTASVTYTLSFGGTSTTAASPSGAANQLEHLTYLIMNNPGSTSAQTISTLGQDSSGGTNSIKLDTATVSTASAVTVNLQFNVASSDAITPEMFLVELKQ
jgi:hypothetical protein